MQLLPILLVSSIVVTSALGAESGDSPQRVMTMDDCIKAALLHNFDVQIKRLSPDISRYNLNVSYGGYDPTFSFSGEHDFNLSPGGVDPQFGPFPGTQNESDRFNTSIQGLLPWGLNYTVGGNLSDRVTLQSGVLQDETSSGSITALQLRQPVLKNFWIDSTRLNIAINLRNLKISELELRFQIMNTVTAVEQAYYNLIFALENVKVQQKALELAERLQAENKKKVEVGALAPLDEKQAEAQAAQSRADLLAAQNSLAKQQNVLKNLLTDDYKTIHDTEVVPAESLLAVPESFNLQQSWENGLHMRPDLLQSRLSLEKQGYIVRFQKNQLFPQLDLFGNYGFNAGNTPEYSGAFGQFQQGNSPFYSAGAQVSMPLGNQSARNNYKAAKVTKEQIALQLRQLEQNVMVQIDDALKQAQSDFERVAATKQARLYQEAALDAEQKKLENGKSTSFQVLIIQRDLTNARSQEIRALADYNNSLAQLALSEGTTLRRRNMSLDVK